MNSIIFDMDGLMFDTERLSTNIWHQVLEEVGLEPNREFLNQIKGSNVRNSSILFKKYYDSELSFYDLNEIRNKKMINYLLSNEIPVKKGLFNLLNYLKLNNYKLALASSSPKEIVNICLNKSKVISYFDYIVSGDMVKNSKPSPDIFLLASNLLNSKPNETYVLEDSYNGVLAGINAKMKVFYIPDEINFDIDGVIKLKDLDKIKEYLEVHNG